VGGVLRTATLASTVTSSRRAERASHVLSTSEGAPALLAGSALPLLATSNLTQSQYWEHTIFVDIYYSNRNYNLTLRIATEAERGNQDSHQAHTL
jgi:hypothetical protein